MTPLKLLIVEDDLASLELMAEVFTSLKAEVRPVSDSEKAAGMVDQEKFDGIFLDLVRLNSLPTQCLVRESGTSGSLADVTYWILTVLTARS
jgi:DNA-binding response OmpR family regulator